jgi:TetR/AcrR family transcriptional regulator, transcriptional repressor for nem operon
MSSSTLEVRQLDAGDQQVGSSQADKAASHDRIVRAAAARIRSNGIDGISVSELMREAGLTHGGFYRHFDSRDELVVQAMEAALADGSKAADSASELGEGRGLAAVIVGYLSKAHRDHPEAGCAVAALPTDAARATPGARGAYTRQVRRYIDLLTGLDPNHDGDQAHMTLAALVGGVLLARAVDDPALSDEILESVVRGLRSGAQPARTL